MFSIEVCPLKLRQKYIRAISLPPERTRRDGGFTLLASVVLTLFLGVLIGSAFMSMNMQLKESDQRIQSHDAFYTAEAGLEYAVFMLRQNSTWRPSPSLTGELRSDPADAATAIGTYTVRVEDADVYNGWPSVWVRSDGIDRLNQVPRTILARVIIQSPTNYLTFTLGDLVIRSGAQYDYDLLARDVDFQVDTALPSGPAHDISIDGRLSYMRAVRSNVDINNPANGVVVTGGTHLSPSITFTGVDLDYYRNLASAAGNRVNSNYNYSGQVDRTSLSSNNGVVFVEGDLHLSGTYTENMVFVATGNIYIDGNITSGGLTDPKPQIGLLSAHDVIIPSSAPNNLNIEAFILADGGSFTAEKTVSKNTLNFNGAMAVRGKSSGLGIDLNAYQIRNYSYNNDFTSSSIPFLPSIANVVKWSEISPHDSFPPSS